MPRKAAASKAETRKTSTKKTAAKRASKKTTEVAEAPVLREDGTVEVEKLGPKVKKIRLEMGLTQNEVAQALHVTPGFICNVENNRTAMSLRVLIYYAQLTGRTLDSIIGLVSSDYEKTALDNELVAAISKLDDTKKTKLLKTLKIWN